MEKKKYKEPRMMREIEANELMFLLETGIEPKLHSDRTNITGDVEEIKNKTDHNNIVKKCTKNDKEMPK